jgi:hypothetical protein
MFGLLGNLSEEQRYGLMMAAAQMMQPGPGGTGGAIGRGMERGLMGYQGAMGLKDRRAQEAQEREARGLMMQQQRQQMADQQGIRDVYSKNTMPGNLAPNDDEGNQMPQAPQGLNLEGLRGGLMSAGPAGLREAAAVQGMMPKPVQPKMAFAPNGQAVDMNALQPGQSYAKTPDWMNPEYIEAQKKIRAAGAPQVTTNVMPPREVFKDSMALKKDFDAQPEVKGFKEVQGAWDQISTALQSPSPANDLAAATKYMKLLDPGSVVRESELMMAMKASGALDRMANYHNRLLKGEKLTPQQRQDFYSAGEALYNASKQRFGETVGQYEGIAQQYGLDPQFIPKTKAPEEKKTVTIGGKKMEARKAPDGKTYVKMGDKYYEVQE